MDGKGKGDGEGMVKGLLLLHVGVMLLLGCVTSSPSLCMLSSPHCHPVLYPGHVVIPCRRRLIIIFVGVVVASLLSSSHVLVVLSLS